MKLTLATQSSELSRINAELATAESTASIFKQNADGLQVSIAEVRVQVKETQRKQGLSERAIIAVTRHQAMVTSAPGSDEVKSDDQKLSWALGDQAQAASDIRVLKTHIKGYQTNCKNLRVKQLAAERQLVKLLRERTEITNATVVAEQNDVSSEGANQ